MLSSKMIKLRIKVDELIEALYKDKTEADNSSFDMSLTLAVIVGEINALNNVLNWIELLNHDMEI